ncbi:MAG: FliM/FliN family flagellar motor switch protein [Planctomycetaceae bacterium]
MTEMSAENTAAIVEHCCGSADAFGASLTKCFGQDFSLQPAEPSVWSPTWNAPGLEQAGLTLRVQLGRQVMLCLIPESVGLPAWYAAPDENQQQQLEVLAQEWSQHSLPDGMRADHVDWSLVENLSRIVSDGNPDPATQIIAWRSAESESSTAIHTIVPVCAVAFEDVERHTSDAAPAGPQDVVLRIPVTVSVRLAQKRIEMGQVLEITPGMLIMFDKPCDEPLDMYVNNHKYCRGEAVKVGDKFGLKIDVIGQFETESERVISY